MTVPPRPDIADSSPPRRPRRWGWLLLKAFLVVAVWMVIVLVSVVTWYSAGLPDLDAIATLTRRPSVTILDSEGAMIASYGDVYGAVVTVKDMPPHLPGAVLAVEDRRFYHHFGVDLIGIARAVIVNYRAGRLVQGGSTITQQVAKNLFVGQERSLKRKIQEALMAVKLERRFSKDQILTLYLNRVYMGAGSYGVDAAAQRYFGVPATHVSVAQAAILAGLLKAPSHYNPINDSAATAQRASVVLDEMVLAGVIDAPQAALAKTATQNLGVSQRGNGSRYFADWVLQELDNTLGDLGQDVIIHTRFDPRLQRAAEAALEKALGEDGAKREASQGAVVVMTPDGAVKAMVGGRSYTDSQFNRATQGLRQPGSTFKAFVYLTALESGLRPDDTVDDGPIRVNGWGPANFDAGFKGAVSLRTAFAHSINTAAVRLSESLGRRKVIATAQRFGLDVPLNAGPSVALGTEATTLVGLTGAYATFANGGYAATPHAIDTITSRLGDLVWKHAGDGRGRIIEEAALAGLHSLMAGVLIDGTAKGNGLITPAFSERPAGGKTGTTQDFRDAWFIGYTADAVTGVWIGNDDNSSMQKVTGGSLPAHVWHDTMMVVEQDLPSRPLPLRRSSPLAVAKPSVVIPKANDPIGQFLGGLTAAPR